MESRYKEMKKFPQNNISKSLHWAFPFQSDKVTTSAVSTIIVKRCCFFFHSTDANL